MRGHILPGQTDRPSVARGGVGVWGRGVPGDCRLRTSCVVLRSLEIESPEPAWSQPSHINTTRGDFPRNFGQPLTCFISHCLPAPLGASTVRAAANTGCFSPRIPRRSLSLPLHAGKLELARCDPLSRSGPASQGIGSVSQLVKQVGGGNTHSTQPTPWGRAAPHHSPACHYNHGD